jgi:CRP-like cAMP-binding protein
MTRTGFVEISHLTWLKSVVGKDLTDAEARELFMISVRDRFARGDKLFEEGSEASALFLVADGEVDILKRLPDGSQHVLATHSGGAVVGEMSLLTREKRSASAIVRSTDATVLRVTWKDLEELLAREPAVAYKLMYALARVLAGRLKTINHRLADLAATNADNNPHEQIEEFQAFKKKLFSDWSF